MLRLGLRRNEALGLIWEDIDFDKGVLHVRMQLARQSTGLGSVLVRRELKTLSSARSLAVGGTLMRILVAWNGAWDSAARDDFVVTFGGGFPVDPDAFTAWFRRLSSECGIRATPHSLRHTSATLMLNAGVPLDHVGKVLGHCDVRSTAVYARVLDKASALALAVLAEVLDS
jgi:integrase